MYFSVFSRFALLMLKVKIYFKWPSVKRHLCFELSIFVIHHEISDPVTDSAAKPRHGNRHGQRHSGRTPAQLFAFGGQHAETPARGGSRCRTAETQCTHAGADACGA